MTSSPSEWATKDEEIPKTSITDNLIVSAPFIKEGDVAFKNETKVVLGVAAKDTDIYFSFDNAEYTKYEEALSISEATILSTYAEKNGKKSTVLSTQFYKIDPSVSITLETEYANQYNAGGTNALIDGIRGSRDFRTGAWQGYQDTDLIAIVDLGSVKSIEKISINFLQDQRSWIFYPTEVECYVSPEKTFSKNLLAQKIASETPSGDSEIKTIQFDMKGNSSRYVKIVAKNLGDLPKWHLGAPFNGKAWIFVDEIEIK